MPTDAEKLVALRAIDGKEVVELVKVSWPAPEGVVYYVSTRDDYLLRSIPIDLALLELRLPGRTFQEILNDTNIADDRVSLKLWDGDERDAAGALIRTGHISDLAATHGAGQRVEIFYWFPQVELLLSMWFGHLQPMTQGGIEWFQCEAATGFMSSMLPLPRRAFFNSCQAMFGGWLQTQQEIDEGDCPYNRHLGGAVSGSSPSWQNVANCATGAGGALTKNAGGDAWNGGASHNVAVNQGDEAFLEVTLGPATGAAGFSITASPLNGNTDFLFGLQWNPDGHVTIRGVDSGHSWANAATWTAGDVFRVELRAGAFRLFKGASEIRPTGFTPPLPAYPLYFGVTPHTQSTSAGVSASKIQINNIGAAPGVGNLDPATSLPFTDCPRNRAACIARLGDDLSYLGFDTVIQSYTVNQTKGANISVTTRGNESNLKRPLRVIIGERDVADCDLLAYTVEPDTKHPEGGAVAVLFAECEGPIQEQTKQAVNGVEIGAMHLNARNGEPRQARTGFSPQVANYSSTALFFGRAQGDFTKISADQLKGTSHIKGLRNLRRYLDATTFIEEYSQSRAWGLLHCLRNRRWGHGLDVARFMIEEDWIPLSAWDAETVTFTDVDGTVYTGPRSAGFNVELIDRSTQQQIADICRAGRYGLPFPYQGKERIVPLKRVDVTGWTGHTFTDEGSTARNICWEGSPGQERSTLVRQILSDADIPNRVVVTFDDSAHGNAERPLTFEDVGAQLRAGRTFGDTTRRAVEKPYALLGVTNLGEAVRLGNLLLHLGEFDEGGTVNNLRVQFTTWFSECLTLKKYDVIKVVSSRLGRYKEPVVSLSSTVPGTRPFEFFRIRSMRRMPDLKVEISAQAYPVDYYNAIETGPPPIISTGGLDNPGGDPRFPPWKVGLVDIVAEADRVSFTIGETEL